MTSLQGPYGITILGQPYRCRAQVDCYIAVLKAFHRLDRQFLPRLSEHKDRKLRLVARNLEDLHEDYPRRPDFVNRHAQRILDGWWVWRDVSAKRVLRNIVWACVFANKKFERDVVVDYPSWRLGTGINSDLLL